MWKAERQRKFKNISLLSQIQYVLYIQRRAKSILMKTVYNPGLQTPVFIKVSRFFCSFFVFVWSSNVIVGHIHYVYLKWA